MSEVKIFDHITHIEIDVKIIYYKNCLEDHLFKSNLIN